MRGFFLGLFILSSLFIQAQNFGTNTCVDSTFISNNPCTDQPYNPVCGCDGITYRNECKAIAQGVLNYAEGPCEFMDFDMPVNLVGIASVFKINIECKDVTDINVWIFDAFFNERYYQVSRQFKEIELFPDITGLGTGVFFMVVEASGAVKVEKFVVCEPN